MKRTEIVFDRPETLSAAAPPEMRGLQRDQVRLLVSSPEGHSHARFDRLADFLSPGDLIVVNESATIPASLPASGRIGLFTLNLSTHYGGNLWLAEPRWGPGYPGPLPLSAGETILVASHDRELIARARTDLRYLFCDRGLLDGLAYCRIGGHDWPDDLHELTEHASYTHVFVLETLDAFQPRRESGRVDSRDGSIRAARLLEEIYRPRAGGITRVPELPVEVRALWVMPLSSRAPPVRRRIAWEAAAPAMPPTSPK